VAVNLRTHGIVLVASTGNDAVDVMDDGHSVPVLGAHTRGLEL
jgi:hypothetical protein